MTNKIQKLGGSLFSYQLKITNESIEVCWHKVKGEMLKDGRESDSFYFWPWNPL